MGDFLGLCCPESRLMLKRKLITSISTSALFIVVYGSCNWITSQRADIGVMYWDWERNIPFIPLFIIPYMSIDAFFVAAPFLCRTQEELAVFGKRIAVGILIAALFFLIMPKTFAFPRLEVEGILGPVFKFLYGFDQPYNLFPSLHIILRTILAHTYARHTKGVAKLIMQIWFSLIGFSTVFVFQHHVPDIIGGFLVAFFLFYVIPEKKQSHLVIFNRRIGLYYALIFLLCLSLSLLQPQWTLFLLWPALSMLLITLGYWVTGPAVFRKASGKIPLLSKLLLAPYLLGQQLYLRSYFNKCRPWDEPVPGLLIGRVLSAKEARLAIQEGVSAVVDMTAEFSESPPFRDLAYLNLQTLDLTAPHPACLQQGVEFIDREIQSGKVYVHCKIGYSRTAVMAGVYLIHSGMARTVDEAVALLKKARPTLIVRPEAREALEVFYAEYVERKGRREGAS